MPIEGAMGGLHVGNRLLATGINSRWHAVNRNHDLEYRSLLEMASLILAVRSAVRLATTEFLLDLARSLVNVADALAPRQPCRKFFATTEADKWSR
jgi:hypothetical protein